MKEIEELKWKNKKLAKDKVQLIQSECKKCMETPSFGMDFYSTEYKSTEFNSTEYKSTEFNSTEYKSTDLESKRANLELKRSDSKGSIDSGIFVNKEQETLFAMPPVFEETSSQIESQTLVELQNTILEWKMKYEMIEKELELVHEPTSSSSPLHQELEHHHHKVHQSTQTPYTLYCFVDYTIQMIKQIGLDYYDSAKQVGLDYYDSVKQKFGEYFEYVHLKFAEYFQYLHHKFLEYFR